MNPSAALQSTVEDFLETLKETPEAAQAELVNCILRACGCNDSVNQDEAVDYDGVVDALDNFTEALKQVRQITLLSLPLNISFLRMIRPCIPSPRSCQYSRSFVDLSQNSSNVSLSPPPRLVHYIRQT